MPVPVFFDSNNHSNLLNDTLFEGDFACDI